MMGCSYSLESGIQSLHALLDACAPRKTVSVGSRELALGKLLGEGPCECE